MDTATLDLELLRLAKLTPVDISRCVGVSRVTASLWVNSRTQPHSLIREKVDRFIDAVRQAVQAERLPVPYSVTRRERGHYLRSVLAEFGYA